MVQQQAVERENSISLTIGRKGFINLTTVSFPCGKVMESHEIYIDKFLFNEEVDDLLLCPYIPCL